MGIAIPRGKGNVLETPIHLSTVCVPVGDPKSQRPLRYLAGEGHCGGVWMSIPSTFARPELLQSYWPAATGMTKGCASTSRTRGCVAAPKLRGGAIEGQAGDRNFARLNGIRPKVPNQHFSTYFCCILFSSILPILPHGPFLPAARLRRGSMPLDGGD